MKSMLSPRFQIRRLAMSRPELFLEDPYEQVQQRPNASVIQLPVEFYR